MSNIKVYIYICIYIYIHTYRYTHTHIPIFSSQDISAPLARIAAEEPMGFPHRFCRFTQGWKLMIWLISGGFLSHRDIPSHHPFRDGFFHERNTLYFGDPPFSELEPPMWRKFVAKKILDVWCLVHDKVTSMGNQLCHWITTTVRGWSTYHFMVDWEWSALPWMSDA